MHLTAKRILFILLWLCEEIQLSDRRMACAIQFRGSSMRKYFFLAKLYASLWLHYVVMIPIYKSRSCYDIKSLRLAITGATFENGTQHLPIIIVPFCIIAVHRYPILVWRVQWNDTNRYWLRISLPPGGYTRRLGRRHC